MHLLSQRAALSNSVNRRDLATVSCPLPLRRRVEAP